MPPHLGPDALLPRLRRSVARWGCLAALTAAASSSLAAQAPAPASAGETPGDSVAAPDPGRRAGGTPFGPLRVSERNPLYHLFLTPVVRGADVEPAGGTSLQVANAYSNIFEYNTSPVVRQRFDLERLSSSLTLLHGLGRGVEVGVQIGVQHSWSGFLDPFIQGVHGTFGLPNADREKVPNNEYQVLLAGAGEGAPVYLDLASGRAIEAPRILLGWRLAGGPGHRAALTVRSSVKLPLGNPSASTGRTDVALVAAFRQSWRRVHLHLTAGGVRLDPPRALAPLMRTSAAVGSAAVEVAVAPAVSLLAQFSGGTRYTRGVAIPELDRPPVNFTVGGAGRWGGWGWQVSFSEDLPPNSPSVDFTLDVQVSRRWPG